MVSDNSLQALRQRLARDRRPGACDESGVRRLWWGALEILQEELLNRDAQEGIWLASPLPALYEPELLAHLQGWVLAPENLDRFSPSHAALPGSGGQRPEGMRFRRLPLHPEDGLDPLLIVITPTLQVALAIHGDQDRRQLLMRCDHDTLGDALALFGTRLQGQSPELAEALRTQLNDLGPLHSDPQLDQQFWPRLAEKLTVTAPSLTLQPTQSSSESNQESSNDLSLLEAITHEVRTPLATIRTLVRSLLRRDDLPAVVQKRLRQIDGECSEQIDRFGLIFHAAELQRQPEGTQLARTDLGSILRSLEPIWRDQLERRQLSLTLDVQPDLPDVLSDPRRLEPMLGGLIDRVSRGLPGGTGLRLELQPAGARLKLQLLVQMGDGPASTGSGSSTEQVGTVLSWDPATGSLQLSQSATRQLMASLGGRYHARRDRDLTVFFPVAPSAT